MAESVAVKIFPKLPAAADQQQMLTTLTTFVSGLTGTVDACTMTEVNQFLIFTVLQH